MQEAFSGQSVAHEGGKRLKVEKLHRVAKCQSRSHRQACMVLFHGSVMSVQFCVYVRDVSVLSHVQDTEEVRVVVFARVVRTLLVRGDPTYLPHSTK
jgi:hypothetical protein